MTRPQPEDEPAVRELVEGGRGHADRGGAAHEYARDARAQANAPRRRRTRPENRELITTVALGHPRRLVTQRLGQLHALDNVRRCQATAERDSHARHRRKYGTPPDTRLVASARAAHRVLRPKTSGRRSTFCRKPQTHRPTHSP